ncbi:MAG: hypothetical protein RLW62_12280 [Gammaproteobacteria bacterium]
MAGTAPRVDDSPPTAGRARGGLGVLLALLAGAPAGAADGDGATDRAAATAAAVARCAPALERRQRINVGAGVYTEQAVVSVPLEIAVPLASDGQRYADCLVREGIDGGAQMEAYVERAAHCRRAAADSRLRIARAGDGVRVGARHDDADYRRCLEGGISVEVLPAEP